MTTNTNDWPNKALTAVCEMLLDEYDLTVEQVRSLAADLPSEFDNHLSDRNERAWDAMQERLMESGGPDDSHYRQSLRDAGRGHLLK